MTKKNQHSTSEVSRIDDCAHFPVLSWPSHAHCPQCQCWLEANARCKRCHGPKKGGFHRLVSKCGANQIKPDEIDDKEKPLGQKMVKRTSWLCKLQSLRLNHSTEVADKTTILLKEASLAPQNNRQVYHTDKDINGEYDTSKIYSRVSTTDCTMRSVSSDDSHSDYSFTPRAGVSQELRTKTGRSSWSHSKLPIALREQLTIDLSGIK